MNNSLRFKIYYCRAVLRIFFSIPLLLMFFNSYSQEAIKKYVQDNFKTINYISKDSLDYSSLNVIGEAIKDCKVVMLGEQDHGDAATFKQKTKIIQYLHEKKGFNILAFESDFFGLNFGWDKIKKDNKVIDSFIKANIYPLWTYCNACSELFYKYIPNSFTKSAPLNLAGVDNQMGSKYLFPIFDSVIKDSQIPISKDNEYSSTILPQITKWYTYVSDSVQMNKINLHLLQIKNELSKIKQSNDFWLLVIDNLISQNIQAMNSKNNYLISQNIRDSQMAQNLIWLVKYKFPNEKIIVWGHNYHISKYGGNFNEEFLNGQQTMGTLFTKDKEIANQTYIIGFTSYQGTAGRIGSKSYTIDKPQKNSFENWVPNNAEFGFIDFQKYNKLNIQDEIFFMSGAIKGNWYHKSHCAFWNRIYDGVFFIRDMYPCEQIK